MHALVFLLLSSSSKFTFALQATVRHSQPQIMGSFTKIRTRETYHSGEENLTGPSENYAFHVLYINLDRSVARRKAMETHLHSMGVTWERFPAVDFDGKLDMQKLHELFDDWPCGFWTCSSKDDFMCCHGLEGVMSKFHHTAATGKSSSALGINYLGNFKSFVDALRLINLRWRHGGSQELQLLLEDDGRLVQNWKELLVGVVPLAGDDWDIIQLMDHDVLRNELDDWVGRSMDLLGLNYCHDRICVPREKSCLAKMSLGGFCIPGKNVGWLVNPRKTSKILGAFGKIRNGLVPQGKIPTLQYFEEYGMWMGIISTWCHTQDFCHMYSTNIIMHFAALTGLLNAFIVFPNIVEVDREQDENSTIGSLATKDIQAS